MPELTFKEDTHEYFLGGIRIPSVSEIISPVNDFSGISPAVLENARQYGKAVHSVIELYLNDKLGEYDPILQQPLDEFISAELLVYKVEEKRYATVGKYAFAGMIDIWGALSAIYDIKTRKYNPIHDDLQLAAYEILTGGKCDKYILELLPNKPYNLVKVENRQAKSMFLYMLEHFWKNQEFNFKLEAWKNNGYK